VSSSTRRKSTITVGERQIMGEGEIGVQCSSGIIIRGWWVLGVREKLFIIYVAGRWWVMCGGRRKGSE